MKKNKTSLVHVYNPQYEILKKYCEKNFEKMVGVVSRLIKEHLDIDDD